MVELYQRALKKYTIKQVLDASYQCLEDMDKFPTPNAIIARIKNEIPEDAVQAQRTICSQCETLKTCIREPPSKSWICPECYSGLSKKEIGARFHVLADIMENGVPEFITTPEQRFNHMKEQAKQYEQVYEEIKRS